MNFFTIVLGARQVNKHAHRYRRFVVARMNPAPDVERFV